MPNKHIAVLLNIPLYGSNLEFIVSLKMGLSNKVKSVPITLPVCTDVYLILDIQNVSDCRLHVDQLHYDQVAIEKSSPYL